MELSKSEWLNIVKQAAGLKLEILQITGGEPLLQKDTLETILNFAKKKFQHIVVNTNGVFVNDYYANLLAGINAIVYVSIYGADAKTYKKVTSVNSFKAAENGILNC